MPPTIRSSPTPWTTIILTCAKCSRKLDGGYGEKGRDTLRSNLNDELRATGRRRQVRVVETKCFGICPRKAVVAVNASQPDRLLEIPRGTAATVALQCLTGTNAPAAQEKLSESHLNV